MDYSDRSCDIETFKPPRYNSDLTNTANNGKQHFSAFQTRTTVFALYVRCDSHDIGKLNTSVFEIVDSDNWNALFDVCSWLHDTVSYGIFLCQLFKGNVGPAIG